MSANKPVQGELISYSVHTGTEVVNDVYRNMPPDDPNPGPSVNIAERAQFLGEMLTHLGKISSLNGFKSVLQEDEPNRSLVSIDEEQKKSLLRAKQSYAKAFGLKELIESELAENHDFNGMIIDSFGNEVIPVFANKEGAPNRKILRSWLNYQSRTMNRQRTQKPKHPLSEISAVDLPAAKPAILEPNKNTTNSSVRTTDINLDPISVHLRELSGHRIAGPSNQAKIRAISNNDAECLVFQGSNGSARLVVPKEYAEVVARALDNGAKPGDILKIIKNNGPSMTANISGRKTGNPRTFVRY